MPKDTGPKCACLYAFVWAHCVCFIYIYFLMKNILKFELHSYVLLLLFQTKSIFKRANKSNAHYSIIALMHIIARCIKSRDLKSPFNFTRILTVCLLAFPFPQLFPEQKLGFWPSAPNSFRS